MSDPLAARARELHRRALKAEEEASRARAERDRAIRALRARDPRRWSYRALADVLGCSRELVAQIVKRGPGPD